MHGEVPQAELLGLLKTGYAHSARRTDAARRRVVEINTELTGLRERLEMLRRAYGSLMTAPAPVVIELAQLDFATKVRVAELDRLLRLTPGLHNEVLDALVSAYAEADAEQAATTGSAEHAQPEPINITLPVDADLAAVAETIKAALDRGVSG